MTIRRITAATAFVLLFGNCAIDEGATEEPQPPAEEPQAPPPGQPPPGETMGEAAARVFEQYRSCMSLADFKAANMTAWSTVTTSAGGHQCRGCHASGTGGFIATDQAEPMFDAIKSSDHLLRVFVIPEGSTPSAMKMVVNVTAFANAGAGGIPEHPRFDPQANAGMTALRAFHERTLQRLATVCAPAPG